MKEVDQVKEDMAAQTLSEVGESLSKLAILDAVAVGMNTNLYNNRRAFFEDASRFNQTHTTNPSFKIIGERMRKQLNTIMEQADQHYKIRVQLDAIRVARPK